MSGRDYKQLLKDGAHKVDDFLNWTPFNTLLLTGSFTHMVIIAMNSCHEQQGEVSEFCGKAWSQCENAADNSLRAQQGDNFTCVLRECFEIGCKNTTKAWGERPMYSDVLALTNYYFRWVYTAITVLRMFGKGFILQPTSFFRNGWNIMDFLVVVSAWMDVSLAFGNLMFFMVLRGFKLLIESEHRYLSVPRVQMKALGTGLFKIVLVFVLLNFIMAFVGLLGISLMGSKGDFHNRCAIPLIAADGSFTYEPIVPELTCRMDHLYSTDTTSCYGDVWGSPFANFTPSSQRNQTVNQEGCRGTCARFDVLSLERLGQENPNLVVTGQDRFGLEQQGTGAYCIGPDYQPPDKRAFPPQPLGGGQLKDYIAANTTNWPNAQNNDDRNWDSIGNAAIVMYTVFYRSSWVEPMKTTSASASDAVVLGWICVMIFTSYYLLNITVSITCAHYSEATVKEAEAERKRQLEMDDPVYDDPQEEEEDLENNREDSSDDKDLRGFEKQPRDKINKEMEDKDYPYPGKGFDVCVWAFSGACMVWGVVFRVCAKNDPFKIEGQQGLLERCADPCTRAYETCGRGFKFCCHGLIRTAARCTLEGSVKEKGDTKEEERKEEKEEKEEKSKRVGEWGRAFNQFKLKMSKRQAALNHRWKTGAPLSSITLICMLGCMLTQGLQNANINDYKCACSDGDIAMGNNPSMLAPCDQAGLCYEEQDVNGVLMNVTTDRFVCITESCVVRSFQGYACYNPWLNPKIVELDALLNRTAAGATRQPAADEWVNGRRYWCGFGLNLHLALFGFAIIFLMELFVRYLAHQGLWRFLTMELHDHEEPKIKIGPFSLPNTHRPNVQNIVDTICILATVAGIAVTEFTQDTQVLLGNVNYLDPNGANSLSPGVPWVVKLLRLATLIRLAIRTPNLKSIPMVAVILRGFRGSEKVAFGVIVLVVMVFFFSLLGKELFDFGYSRMTARFDQLSDFSDLSQSIIPLFEIMVGSGWYEYLEAGVQSLGVIGFLYFTLYFFIVNFQFLRIFIAIIVQNYELNEEEKIQAQQMILELNFKAAETRTGEKHEMYRGASWTDNFSFTTHYYKLLKGAQISLRNLEEYQRRVAAGDKGFSDEAEHLLGGETYSDTDDEEGENKKQEVDEVGKMEQTIKKVRNRLTINPQDITRKEGVRDEKDQKSRWQQLREAMKKLVKNEKFNWLVIIVVLVSTAFAVLPEISQNIQSVMSLVFLGFFLAEMVMKMIAYSLFGDEYEPRGYFTRGWCILDAVLVALQLFDVLVDSFPDAFQLGDSADIFKGFRAIRIARLLSRLTKKIQSVKVILLALGASLPAIMMLLIAVIFMMFVFALVGMDQYMGTLDVCQTESDVLGTGTRCITDSNCWPGYVGQCLYEGIGTFGYCRMDKQHCYGERVVVPYAWSFPKWKSVTSEAFSFPVPRVWQAPPLTFNDLPSAMYTCFCLINRSGIRATFVALLSATERDMAPREGNNYSATAYVIVLILIVGIFVSQVVVGIIMTNLRLKTGLAFHTREQLVWPATKDQFDFMPRPGAGVIKKRTLEGYDGKFLGKLVFLVQIKFAQIASSTRFNTFLQVTVAFNCALLAVLYFDMPGDLQEIYFWGGFACFIVYCLEFVVKMVADPWNYMRSWTNLFDIFLTLLNAFDLFVAPWVGIDLGLSSLRMFRLFRLLKQVPDFVQLLETIYKSAPQALASVVLTFITIFIFAAVGTRMFTYVKEGEELDTNFNNFSVFWKSLIAMFRVSSGANWSTVLSEAGITTPACTPKYWTPVDTDDNEFLSAPADDVARLQTFGNWTNGDTHARPWSDCGIEAGAYGFFLLFVFINNYIILPTFVASIISSYFEANLKENSLVSKAELQVFVDCWHEVVTGQKHSEEEMKFEKNTDKATKEKNPFIFDRFDQLLSILQLRECRLGFSKAREPDKYKHAIKRLKDAKPERGGSAIKINYKRMAVILLSIAEKTRPVTIVDILRRKKAEALLKEEGGQKHERLKKQEGGDLHAGINLPDPKKMKSKNLLKNEDVQYSYNIYVVLDQLSRMEQDKDRISAEEHKRLKQLCEDNNEDLFVYFEEYVEKSGPVYQKMRGNEAFKAFIRFGKRAKEVYSRSKYNDKKKSKKNKTENEEEEDGEGHEYDHYVDDEHEDDEMRHDDESAGQSEVGSELRELVDIRHTASDAEVPKDAEEAYGHVLEDEKGILDLRNWTTCAQCGDPVDRAWGKCPNCNKIIQGGVASAAAGVEKTAKKASGTAKKDDQEDNNPLGDLGRSLADGFGSLFGGGASKSNGR